MGIRKSITYGLAGMLVVAVALTAVGLMIKKRCVGRIAPGVVLCGQDVSGMTPEELTELMAELLPETVTEISCGFLPEMQDEIRTRIETEGLNTILAGEKGDVRIEGDELCLTVKTQLFRVQEEETLQAVVEKSSEVKVWEWLYAEVTGRLFRERTVAAVFTWNEKLFQEYCGALRSIVERERVEATVGWEKGQIVRTESQRGFRLDTEKWQADVEHLLAEVIGRLETGPVEGLVLRFYVSGTALMPRLSTAQAENCNTVIGEFTTSYAGAGAGRAQNIKVGAEKLHRAVVLPGEEFSVAAALMPFTEENGYASGGTYIDGQLSESIGGGVCQLSTTLYNALLQTKLTITERHPHSMPVGYIPLGQDAAIAGDYKDLRFVNTTETPILLLCEATRDEVEVTVYGAEEAMRGSVIFESRITEENEEGVTVEVYRVETGENGEKKRERVSRDRYRVRKGG